MYNAIKILHNCSLTLIVNRCYVESWAALRKPMTIQVSKNMAILDFFFIFSKYSDDRIHEAY